MSEHTFNNEEQIGIPFPDHNRPSADDQPFKITTEYGHTMCYEQDPNVTVVFRSGLRKTVRSLERGRSGYFIVRKTYSFMRSQFDEAYEFFKHLNEDKIKTQELRILKQEFLKEFDQYRRSSGVVCIRIILDIMTPAEQFRNDDRAIYINSEDILVSLNGINQAIDHPFTDPLSRRDYLKRLAGEMSSINFDISLISNDNEIDSLYYLFGGEVRCIRARESKDRTQPSGLYITTYVRDDPDQCSTIVVSLDDPSIESIFHMHTTRYKAKSSQENLTQKNSFELKKAEEDLLAAKRQLTMIEHENRMLQEIIKGKNLDRSDKYEERSLERKELIDKNKQHYEQFKNIVGYIGTALTLIQIGLKIIEWRQTSRT